MREKEVFTIPDLVEIGYPEKVLREIARSENFADVGFKSGRKAFFRKDLLNKELQRRTRVNA